MERRRRLALAGRGGLDRQSAVWPAGGPRAPRCRGGGGGGGGAARRDRHHALRPAPAAPRGWQRPRRADDRGKAGARWRARRAGRAAPSPCRRRPSSACSRTASTRQAMRRQSLPGCIPRSTSPPRASACRRRMPRRDRDLARLGLVVVGKGKAVPPGPSRVTSPVPRGARGQGAEADLAGAFAMAAKEARDARRPRRSRASRLAG